LRLRKSPADLGGNAVNLVKPQAAKESIVSIQWIRRKIGAGAGIGAGGVRRFKRTYNIRSTIASELRSAILAHPSLPKYGAPHPEDLTCTCSDLDLEQREDDPFLWTLQATWETAHSGGRNETEDQKQPDLRRPKWAAKFQPISNFLPRDRQGKLFCDSAGTPFDPPPDMPIWVRAITIERYESKWSEDRDLGLINATNTDVWRSSQPKEVLIADVTCAEEWVMGKYWFRYVYTLLQNPKIALPGGAGTIGGWDPLLIVDAGPKILDGSGKAVVIPDDNGLVDGRPRFLDGAGHLKAAELDGSYKPFLLQFQVKQFTSFDDLKLLPPWDPAFTFYTPP
jgi:hypothetical protein